MQYDYLIAGQGIAGTVLSRVLLQQGKTVLVADAPQEKTASKVAAGLFNPITGRKMVKTWQAEAIFPQLHRFYHDLQKELGTSFFYPENIYVPFDSQEKQNDWLARSADPAFQPFLGDFTDASEFNGAIKARFGGINIAQAGYINLPVLLAAWRKYLQQCNLLLPEKVRAEQVQVAAEGIHWQGVAARRLIFCEGPGVASNPLFNWLPFRPVKGELLVVKFRHWPWRQIVNRGCWVLPTGNGLCKAGATYNNRDHSWQPTEEGRQQLLEKLHALVNEPFEVVQHLAGVRPATYDRRPFAGMHPVLKNAGIFNGLGAKGVSLAPWLATAFAACLEQRRPLEPGVDIKRVFRKYPQLQRQAATAAAKITAGGNHSAGFKG